MTLLERAGQWINTLVYPLVLLLILLPPFFLEVYTSETFKVNQEYLVVLLGWFVIVAVGVARALGGHPVLGGGRHSWARLALGGLAVWMLITSAFAYNSAASWMYAASAVTYLLVAQSLLDWVELEPAKRRGFVFASLAVLVTLQTLIAYGQIAKAPFMDWSKAMPVFLDNGRVLPWSYYLKDAFGAIGVAARDGKPIGTIGNINYLAEFVALMIPVLAGWTMTLKRRWLQVLMGIVLLGAFGALFATGARAAMVGMLGASVVSALFVFGTGMFDTRKWWSTPRGKVIVSVAAVVTIAAIVLVGGRVLSKFEVSGGMSDTSIKSRVVNWQAAIEMAKDNPVMGYGLGSYKLRNVTELAEKFPEGIPEGAARTRFLQAHNEPLQGAAELGLVGLLLCVLGYVFWCRETLSNESMEKPLRFGLLAGLGALLLSSLFGFPFHIPVTALMVMIVLALGLAGREPAPEPMLAPAGRIVYALVALVLLGAAGYQVYAKDIGPYYMAHRYLYVAEKVAAKENSDTAIATLSLADRFDRYRGAVRWKILKALVLGKEYEAALKLHEASAKEGLGKDSLYWKARALQELGRNQEAYDTFSEMVRYYPDSHPMDKRGKTGMKRLEPKLKATSDKPAT